MFRMAIWWGFGVILITFLNAAGQKVITGTIRDGETGELLPAANIQIAGTFKGTISNEQGVYRLNLEELPATLAISYIGYASERLTITGQSDSRQDIRLTPIAYQLEPIIVTGEDPAVAIMREVIRRKQIWRASLRSFQAETYNRMVLENDTNITSIMESISLTYWDHKKGIREVVKSRRQTSNMTEDQNFASVGEITNLYDDDIEIGGFRLIGITHPDALNHYQFTLQGHRQRDQQVVYDISVNPRGKLQPAFVGKIAVLDSVFALLEVDLKPNEAVMFPPPIRDFDFSYKQQFNNFGSDYWLPIDIRIDGQIKIGVPGLEFPSIIIRRVSRLTDYQMNVTLPDSLFRQKEQVTIDSAGLKLSTDSVFTQNPEVVPFSTQEEQAYVSLDSTMTLEKAYRPTGPLARFVRVEVEGEERKEKESSPARKIFSGITPVLSFDRVDEVTMGLKKSISPRLFRLELFGGYKTGHDNWFYGGKIQFRSSKKIKLETALSYSENTATRYPSLNYPLLFSSIHTLLGYREYFDFYRNQKFRFDLAVPLSPLKSKLIMGYHQEQHHSLEKTTDYNIVGKDIIQRENPAIQPGRLRAVSLKWVSGEDYIPFGIIGQNRLEISLEHSSPDFLASDFDYTAYQMQLDLRIPTFLRRRLLPNVLDLHITAGSSRGNLPLQRYRALDGSLQIFAPFPSFRSLIGKAYEGEKYLGIFWEHHFRTVPFELLGLRGVAQKNIGIILYGASGRTWIQDQTLQNLAFTPVYTDRFHHEIGLALNGLFDLFRIDFTRRLDTAAFYAGFGLSRLF